MSNYKSITFLIVNLLILIVSCLIIGFNDNTIVIWIHSIIIISIVINIQENKNKKEID